MQELHISDQIIRIYPAGQGDPVVYLHSEAEGAEKLFSQLEGVSIVAIETPDWDKDLSPWPAKAVFKGSADFSGLAQEHLDLMLEEMIPQAEAILGQPKWRAIAGYSLAGLFALWAVYKTDVFQRGASVSGSMWYPQLDAFAAKMPERLPERFYFSLGDREEKTRNQVMQTVRARTEEIYRLFEAKGVETVFELNSGGHFDDPDGRVLKGINWLMK